MCAHIAVVAARRARDEGEAHLAGGDFVAAERSFTDVLSHLGDGAGRSAVSAVVSAAHIGLGRVCLGRDQPARAAAEFAAALRAQPDSWSGFYWAGCAAAHQADYPGAEWNLTEALRCGPPLPRLTRALVQRAYVRLRQHAEDTALTDLVSAARHGELDDNAWLVMASLQVRCGRWREAETSLDHVGSPGWEPVVATWRALALEHQGDDLGAFSAYRQVLDHSGAADGVLFHHGRLALRLDRVEDCLRSWTELARRNPWHTSAGDQTHAGGAGNRTWDDVLVEVHLHAAVRAVTLDEQEGLQRARQHLLGAYNRRNDDHRVLHYLALLEFLTGAHHVAERLWTALDQARPDDGRTRHALAICAIQRGELDRAERELVALSGVTTDPVARRAARGVAAVQVRRGRWHHATVVLESMTGDDQWRDTVLPECAYRCASGPEQAGAPLGLWHAARQVRAGQLDAALELLHRANGGTQRARRELGLLLRGAALEQAKEQRWEYAAALLVTSRELIGERPSFALLDAAVCVLGGQRAAAIQILVDASRRAPADHQISHALAVVVLHSLGGEDVPATAPASWPCCIAAWVAVLHDTAFWEQWRRRAEQRYRTPVSTSQLEWAREGAWTLLRERLRRGGDSDQSRGTGAGHSPRDDLLFQREVDAARVLERLGGFPVSGAVLVCGPLRIAQLGLHRAFGAFVDRIRSANREAAAELRRCFSQLGAARCHLREGRPARALAALADLRCPHCAARTAVTGPAVCVPDCAWFDVYNPAYAALEGKGHQLSRDSLALAAEARLRLGQDEIVGDEPDLARESRHWREAIELASELGEGPEMHSKIVDMALGRAEALERQHDVDGAITVLETARGLTDAPARSRVDGQLARLLTIRGIETANAAPDQLAELADAVHDLRRALSLNRHLLRARVNLVKALRVHARRLRELPHQQLGRGEKPHHGVATEPMVLLREALKHCDKGLTLTPGHDELVEQRDKALAALRELEGRW